MQFKACRARPKLNLFLAVFVGFTASCEKEQVTYKNFEVRLVASRDDAKQAPAWNKEIGDALGRGGVGSAEGSIPVATDAVVSASDLEDVKLGKESIDLRFKSEAKSRLAEFTREHYGQRVAFIVAGRVVEVPVIRQPTTDGRISLAAPEEDLREMYRLIVEGN